MALVAGWTVRRRALILMQSGSKGKMIWLGSGSFFIVSFSVGLVKRNTAGRPGLGPTVRRAGELRGGFFFVWFCEESDDDR